LEGAEYLDYKESRVFISWGTARLNLKNSNPSTMSLFRDKYGSLKYPALNTIDYGYSEVEYMSLLEQDDTMEFLKGSKPEVFRYFKNNGTYDNRYNPRLVGGGLRNAKGHVAITAVETINWGLSKWVDYEVKQDYKLSEEHEKVYLKFVVPAITETLNSGDKYIPQYARNDFSLSLIANTILYGEKVEDYEDLYEMGMKIYNEIAKKPEIPNREQLKTMADDKTREVLEVKKDNIQSKSLKSKGVNEEE
tara:strand:+ start:2471 stop:3217 length:747 start_codon:yes stop_codon:yes gene_type:complete